MPAIIHGRLSEGIRLIEETRQNIIESGRDDWIAFWEHLLGSIYLQMLQGGEKPSLAFLVKNIGFLVKNAPRAERKAQAHFSDAIELAKKVGHKGVLGRSYLDLGTLHRVKKRFDKARDCFSKAIEVFEETAAEGHLKQAKEALESINE